MGSTGSGRFSDYSTSNNSTKKDDGDGGGSGGIDRCSQAFSCTLEEVSQCDYYTNNNNTPAVGSRVIISLTSRLFATTSTGEEVGALPTRLHYIAACLQDGYSYVGVITMSTSTPVPSVIVDFTVE